MMPLVSCVMVTANRRHLIPMAVRCYLSQTYENRELIVVDDGEDAVGDLFESIPNLTYEHRARGLAVSEKVNRACELADGSIIATWDDDDYSAPDRLTDQVTRLLDCGKVLTGYHSLLFCDGKRAWKYLGNHNYATGTSQVYLKSFWESHRLKPKNIAYDNDLWADAVNVGAVSCVDAGHLMVARIHGQNVSGERKSLGCEMWPEVPMSEIPLAFFDAMRCQ